MLKCGIKQQLLNEVNFTTDKAARMNLWQKIIALNQKKTKINGYKIFQLFREKMNSFTSE